MERYNTLVLAILSTTLITIANSVVYDEDILPPNLSNQSVIAPLLNIVPENFNLTKWSLVLRNVHPHTYLTAIEIIRLHKYDAEVHEVETDDGYILQLHRIPDCKKSPKAAGKPVVFLQHGILSSSVDWVMAGPERGFAFLLADAGYDVWMGNARGNIYSRKHKKLTDRDSQYWSFSWHEMGVHDLPAVISHILKISEQQKLYYIGHSQGSTSFFVMLSEHPEYNDKIHAMFSLAPVAYCSHMRSPIFQFMALFDQPIKILTALIGINEFKPTDEFFTTFTTALCQERVITQPICENVLFMIAGFNEAQMDLELLPAILAHVPAGASVNQFIHYSQIIKSGKFQQMDFGWYSNLMKYGSLTPPSYSLTNVKVPIALHYSGNDLISSSIDVEKLLSKLPNPIGKFQVSDRKFSHLDYLWAKDVKTLLYDQIMSIMLRYKD
ncbi:lipase 3-like [Phymastichus coffea]|uniref:lipase 3-like n=1 Tax=Phymastichus coffea TaxID=108790 RepID=UPI00273B36F7|nr:lipase 3-like [Phymastichus coffea]